MHRIFHQSRKKISLYLDKWIFNQQRNQVRLFAEKIPDISKMKCLVVRSCFYFRYVHCSISYKHQSTSQSPSTCLVVVSVSLICIAIIIAAIAVAKYGELNKKISNFHGHNEDNYNACPDSPCRNDGKCVKIVQGGYYCICDSQKYYGRHCEQGRLKIIFCNNSLVVLK